VWRGVHWQLFAVRGARSLTQGPATLVDMDSSGFVLDATGPGRVLVRVRWSPYWALAEGRGCVERAHGGWTRVVVRAAGTVDVSQRFSPWRAFASASSPRCR
jgi:hypothetical protein